METRRIYYIYLLLALFLIGCEDGEGGRSSQHDLLAEDTPENKEFARLMYKAKMAGGGDEVHLSNDYLLQAHRIHPWFSVPLFNLGSNYIKLGDYHNAAKYYQQAFEIDPTSYDVNLYLAISYTRIGKHRSAVYHFERAQATDRDRFQSDPSHPDEILVQTKRQFFSDMAHQEPISVRQLVYKRVHIDPESSLDRRRAASAGEEDLSALQYQPPKRVGGKKGSSGKAEGEKKKKSAAPPPPSPPPPPPRVSSVKKGTAASGRQRVILDVAITKNNETAPIELRDGLDPELAAHQFTAKHRLSSVFEGLLKGKIKAHMENEGFRTTFHPPDNDPDYVRRAPAAGHVDDTDNMRDDGPEDLGTLSLPDQGIEVFFGDRGLPDRHFADMYAKISKSQNPTDCSTAKFVTFSLSMDARSGFGAHMMSIFSLVSWGVRTGHVIIARTPDRWSYAAHTHRGFNAYFLPLSKCTMQDAQRSGNVLHARNTVFGMSWEEREEVPEKFKKYGLARWRSALARYVMRPRLHVLNWIRQHVADVHLNRPSIATLVRHGDKFTDAGVLKVLVPGHINWDIWNEYKSRIPLSVYIDKIKSAFLDHPKTVEKYGDEVQDASYFLVTDSSDVVQDASWDFAEYDITTLQENPRMGDYKTPEGGTATVPQILADARFDTKAHTYQCLANLFLTASCDYFIGTFSSCYHRLAYDLWQSQKRTSDFRRKIAQSLDSEYYVTP